MRPGLARGVSPRPAPGRLPPGGAGGAGGAWGTVPRTITAMAQDAIAFADALGLTPIDLLGYSIGGMIAQELALLWPQLVRRLVLAGTGPQGGQLMHGWISDVAKIANAESNGPEEFLRLFFEITETSRQKGQEYHRPSRRCAGRCLVEFRRCARVVDVGGICALAAAGG